MTKEDRLNLTDYQSSNKKTLSRSSDQSKENQSSSDSLTHLFMSFFLKKRRTSLSLRKRWGSLRSSSRPRSQSFTNLTRCVASEVAELG